MHEIAQILLDTRRRFHSALVARDSGCARVPMPCGMLSDHFTSRPCCSPDPASQEPCPPHLALLPLSAPSVPSISHHALSPYSSLDPQTQLGYPILPRLPRAPIPSWLLFHRGILWSERVKRRQVQNAPLEVTCACTLQATHWLGHLDSDLNSASLIDFIHTVGI